MKILMLASEATPLVKVGGLGDVVGALPVGMRALGHDVRVALPHYNFVSESPSVKSILSVKWGRSQVESSCTETLVQGTPYLLIGGRPVASSGSVYGENAAIDALKFVFFSLATLHHVRAMGFQPDVVHVHDAHPGAALRWLQENANEDPFWHATGRVLTIHNLVYQYNEAADALALGGINPAVDDIVPTLARSGLLALAIRASDRINAVSPTYAKEILTPEHGAGLHGLLSARSGSLSGILNGVHYDEWDPAKDVMLAKNYTMDTLSDREDNKYALQQEVGLRIGQGPLLGVVSRLDHQKGLDLLVQVLPALLRRSESALVLLGSGDGSIQAELQQLAVEFPDRVALSFRFDERLARRIYAGADMLLVPSRYEPCGLVQMIALRYGAVPLVRATGGLRDTVKDYDVDPAAGNGFVFNAFNPEALSSALERALHRFEDQSLWRGLQLRGMELEFSWTAAGRAYEALYMQAMIDRSGQDAG